MKAGRELDAAIAEKVMGISVDFRDWACGVEPSCGTYEAALDHANSSGAEWFKDRGPVTLSYGFAEPIPFYSTSIAAAWQVVEKMRERQFIWELCGFFPYDGKLSPFGASFVSQEEVGFLCYDDTRASIEQRMVLAETAPLAICLAALKAFEKEGA